MPTRLGFLVVLLSATLMGLDPDLSPGAIALRAGRAIDPTLSGTALIDAGRNLLLFAGWGMTWMATAAPGTSIRALKGALLSGASISLGVEIAQLFSARRVASVVDFTTNSGGALAGALILVFLVRMVARLNEGRGRHRLPAAMVAAPVVFATWLEAVIPLFRHDPMPRAYGWPWIRARIVLAEFDLRSVADIPWSDAPLFLIAGALAALAISGTPPEGRSEAKLVLLGAAGAVLAEGLHAPFGYRMLAGAALLHATAWGAGVLLARLLTTDPRVLMRLSGCLVSLWLLRPFEFGANADGLSPLWWVPLGTHGQSADVWGMADVAATFLIYLPLGALLAVHPLRTRGSLRGVLPALYLAATAEAAQLFVVGRTPDGTDLLVATGGVLIGWVVTRRGGLGPAPSILV